MEETNTPLNQKERWTKNYHDLIDL